MEQPSSFFSSLFDFSFSTFVTTKIIKVLFVLGIIFAGLWSIMIFFSLASKGGASTILGLILIPLLFILGVIYFRVVLEIIIVIFRIAENTSEIAQRGRSNFNSVPPANPG